MVGRLVHKPTDGGCPFIAMVLKPGCHKLESQSRKVHLSGVRGVCLSDFSRTKQGTTPYGGFHSHGGTPKWMVYREHPIKMDDLGVALFWEPHHISGSQQVWEAQKWSRAYHHCVLHATNLWHGRPTSWVASELSIKSVKPKKNRKKSCILYDDIWCISAGLKDRKML